MARLPYARAAARVNLGGGWGAPGWSGRAPRASSTSPTRGAAGPDRDPPWGSPRNLGAAARNLGTALATTELVAFCNDDSWFEPGALEPAAAHHEGHPEEAAVATRVVVEPDGVIDPTCHEMARSPLGTSSDRCKVVLGFSARGVVVRRQAL